MVFLLLRFIGLVVMVLVLILWIHALVNAPLKPDSWDEETGKYVKCSDCCWTCDDDYSFFGEPGPGCRDCPFCYKPGK